MAQTDVNKKCFPVFGCAAEITAWWSQWRGELPEALKRLETASPALLPTLHRYSPYLYRQCLAQPDFALRVLEEDPASLLAALEAGLLAAETDISVALRRCKSASALVIGLADVLGLWGLNEVVRALSHLADVTVQVAFAHAWQAACAEARLAQSPAQDSGIAVIALGKWGGRELNYSSDIDFMVIFDGERLERLGARKPAMFASQLVQRLVQLLQERRREGYVWRCDTRLRPDPGSTQLAVSLDGSIRYYERVGQNWERAALIKARTVAGDVSVGEALLRELQPFIWRRSLDFNAMADIQSIQRQMQSALPGQRSRDESNLKLGPGGIRDIEFFVQTRQLIWGGRMPELRTPRTLDALHALVATGHVAVEEASVLEDAYRRLRHAEHRVQMVEDQQTHQLPADLAERERLAPWLDRDGGDDFTARLADLRQQVRSITGQNESLPPLGASGRLVFTGVESDPGTLETIQSMGFAEPGFVSDCIRAWHHGQRRATRTKRARELITELTPLLLKALVETPAPDAAFARFDHFLTNLPAGIQIFSLFHEHPELMRAIAVIMGSAPALADRLSQRPELLDAILSNQLANLLEDDSEFTRLEMEPRTDLLLRQLGRIKAERELLIGMRMLEGTHESGDARRRISALAERILGIVIEHAREQFRQDYGRIEGAGMAVVALGRLGAKSLTFGSDLDLIFLYDAPDDTAESDGRRSFPPNVYFNRLSQRILGHLSAPERYGALYEVDTRLRPAGKDGPLAVSLAAFDLYYREQAWSYERMAMTKARVLWSDGIAEDRLRELLRSARQSPQPPGALAHDIAVLRGKIAAEFPPDLPWQIKHANGGLLEMDFLLQFLLLSHGWEMPGWDVDAITARAVQESIFDAQEAADLAAAYRLQDGMLSFLRLCCQDTREILHAGAGLKAMLVARFEQPDFESLTRRIATAQQNAHRLFTRFVLKRMTQPEPVGNAS